MISEQLVSLTSQGSIPSNGDVKHKSRKARESNEKDIKGNKYK